MVSRAKSPRSPLSRFLWRLPLALLAAILIWAVLRPGLDTSIRWMSQTLVRAFEYPRVTMLEPDDKRGGHYVQIHRSDWRATSQVLSLPLTEIHFNTIVLLTLFLALARAFSRRQLERLFMGWCLLFAFQIINLWFHVKCFYATGLGDWSLQSYSIVERSFYEYGQYFTDLPGRLSFPFVIWIGYNWDQLMILTGRAAPVDEDEPAQHPSKKTKKKKPSKKSRKR